MIPHNKFTELLKKVKQDSPKLYERSLQSLEWYRKKIEREFGAQVLPPTDVYSTRSKKMPPFAGQLMTFRYYPKNAASLNFYDMYPLILTIDIDATSILGLNFHYLKPLHRIIFMDELYKYLGTRFNEPVIRIDYKKLMSKSTLKYYKPCIKRYLFKNISQQISIIGQDEWELAMFLPTEKFVVGSGGEKTSNKQKIWENSASIIKKV